MYPITFDCVTTPGYRKCRIVDPDDYNSVYNNKDNEINLSENEQKISQKHALSINYQDQFIERNANQESQRLIESIIDKMDWGGIPELNKLIKNELKTLRNIFNGINEVEI
jgi:hypothetical protein